MRATGIVRRIDDLGRIVVPKEIRRTLRIREGDSMEIYTGHAGEILLKKYSPMGEMNVFAQAYAESLAQTAGNIVLIADTDQIIAVAAAPQLRLNKNKWLGLGISDFLLQRIVKRKYSLAFNGEKNYINICREMLFDTEWQIIVPIICEGDAIGAVIIQGNNDTDSPEMLAKTAAVFLGKQLEN